MKLNGLEKFFKTVNGEIINFKQLNKYSQSPLIFALRNNKSENLNLTEEQFDYLIKNSDLMHVNIGSMSPLMYALKNNQLENLNLNHTQFDYLIKNSDLKKTDVAGYSPLMFALASEKNLNKEQWKHLMKNSDLSLIKNEQHLLTLKKYNQNYLMKKC